MGDISLTGPVSPLRMARSGSDTSTLPESLPTPSFQEESSQSVTPTRTRRGNRTTVRVATEAGVAGMAKTRSSKRALRRVYGGSVAMLARARGASAIIGGISPALLEPGMIMKFSTMATASGVVCLVLTVFSGPALVFLAVIALGVCGMCFGVRQRGMLEYLPRSLVNLLTRTTLLEFLTDTSGFDAIKNYLVFMVGLSADETQRVLRSLPAETRDTLMRPGLMHTLPVSLQGFLLSANQTAPARLLAIAPSSSEEHRGRARRRRRRAEVALLEGLPGEVVSGTAGTGEGGWERREDAEREEVLLGQLVWNPLPDYISTERPPSSLSRETTEQDAQHPGHNELVAGHIFNEDGSWPTADGAEEGEEKLSDGERRDSGEEGGDAINNGAEFTYHDAGVVSRAARCPSREHSPRHARSLSPTSTRERTQDRRALEGFQSDRTQPSRTRPHASPEPPQRQRRARGLRATGSRSGEGTSPTVGGGLVSSAESVMTSIFQSRVDNAVKAAWSAVDERSVRRAAAGSGIALVAHMALSKRARRQAGLMMHGGILAALAGTATVCAGLAYLKPGEAADCDPACADANQYQPTGIQETPNESSGVSNRPREEERGGSLSRVRKYRSGLRRLLTALSPNTRNLVRLLGMICILLAVRKWQLLRRLALRAAVPKIMYRTSPP